MTFIRHAYFVYMYIYYSCCVRKRSLSPIERQLISKKCVKSCLDSTWKVCCITLLGCVISVSIFLYKGKIDVKLVK